MRLTGLDHVQLCLPAGAEPAARAFYAATLGLRELAKPPLLAARGGCWFAGPGFELHLGVEEPFIPARRAHPGLATDTLDEVAATLQAAGAPVVWADPAEIPGRRRLHTEDPFGNRLEFSEIPSWTEPGGDR